ncbi:guanine nucleotide exchange factor DBS [Boleophthalmus pectinirostris]|uniref:guanine nucleotide exchange factor DBS n=1 Tax=Boleophthalmus pectinirostris TaxID=150288 RepID=UPI00242D3E68|nr:guanine nucleotide exchange factor DBS [Boleophthalmus pectinirostris]
MMALNRVSRLCHEVTRLWIQLKICTDELVQDESLCAAHIGSELQRQFAFRPGGRGLSGGPIIIFPEFPDFHEIQEEELHHVLTYLTSIHRTASGGLGFILVIDRRLDRWAAVKSTLLRIAEYFGTGQVQSVLVLRPTTLLQRTLSDLLFKFNRDDFRMKVVMLSSVAELHAYIDPGQLTTELGGHQEYNHESWISHRTAIEAFALMVTTTAQALQTFGAELAETELPNDAESTSALLSAHGQKKDDMKEDLQVALSQGRRLLECINEPLQDDPEYHMTQDEMENLVTVQRLLGQLDETETAFDDFWERHRLKLEQCLQLRNFEINFRQVRSHLSTLWERVSSFSEVTVSPAHAEHVLKELSPIEDRAAEVLDLARSLVSEGDFLISSSHYAEDSIRPKCLELRSVCDEVVSVLKNKKNSVQKTLELHRALEKELLKYSKGCDGADDLQEALNSILGILKAVNDSMHLIAITGYEGNLSDLGRLLMQGSFSVWTEHKKGHAKVKDLARFKPMQRHLFLHQRALLFCKRREESGEGYEKAPSYSFKHSLSMSAVGITENAKGDNKKFEIWCNSRDEVFIVQAPTAEVKSAWVNEIRKVLTEQLHAFREASQQKSSEIMSPTTASNSPVCLSPFRNTQKNQKNKEEKKTEPSAPTDSPKHKAAEEVTSPTSDRAVARKRFTLQGFGNLKSPKVVSPEHTSKRHLVKSDPTPLGFKGWSKTSLSVDVCEENDGYSSGEEPLNSDTEEDGAKKLSPGRYTVVCDCEKSGGLDVSVKNGDTVQLIREGHDGLWFVKNLRSSREGWVSAANLLSLISQSKSSQSLSSSDGSVSGNLSTSSSCSETYTSYSDIKP